jgi:hypothetical protein
VEAFQLSVGFVPIPVALFDGEVSVGVNGRPIAVREDKTYVPLTA